MKLDEENLLKGNATQLKKYLDKNPLSGSFYNEIDSLNLVSLQEISFIKNLKFFNEINFILSVIISIISHPHISNKSEDVIVKAGQSGALKDDSFQRTIKDARLWKRKNTEMVVEEVYNYMNVDEIKIYENVFIVMLILLLDNQISKYEEFYNSLINVVDYSSSSLLNENVSKALDKLNLLKNKIRKIKETNFYKEVNKNFKPINKIQPTNILLKDRLYNICYKFYKKITSNKYDENFRKNILTSYYILFLKALKKNDFTIYPTLENKEIDKEDIYKTSLNFDKDNFHIGIIFDKSKLGFNILVENTDLNNEIYHHFLFVDETNIFSYFENEYEKENEIKYKSYEAISLWNIAYMNEGLVYRYINRVSEEKMIEDYLLDRILLVEGPSKIYAKYCPLCKNKNVDKEGNEYICLNCSSSYYIYFNKRKEYIFFNKVRRLF